MLRALVRTRVPRRHFADKVPVPKTPTPTPTPTTTIPPPSATATPKTLPGAATTTTPPPKIPASTPPPPKPLPGIGRRLGRLTLRLGVLTTLAFGGGVVYSRYNDNFHDFFTEYIPYGETALLYLQELDFRKRYADAPSHRSPQAHDTTVPQVIGPNSGVSWRVADAESSGRTSSAVKKGEEKKPEAKGEPQVAAAPSTKAEPKIIAKEPKTTPAPENQAVVKGAKAGLAAAESAKAEASAPAKPPAQKPKSERIKQAQLLDLPDAREPIVQDVVHLLNDLITVINADNEQWKYAGAIARAKERMGSLGDKIRNLRTSEQAREGQKVHAQVELVDKEINALAGRFDQAVASMQDQWRRELTAELEGVRDAYERQVGVLLDGERQAYEEKLRARLDAQAVAMRRELEDQVQDQVEKERGGRLSRLGELSSAVESLEKLATSWSDVVDGNLRTQQLHVALEAVRARLHDAEPRGFVRELAALKLVAEDPIVDAAIASIPPTAYQRGVPSAAALVDRFRRVAAEVRKAALLPEDAGLASHVGSWALSKVLFKRDGAVVGVTRDGADDDVEGVLAKTQMLLEEGDLDGAAREMNGLTGWAKALSKDWLGEVRKVLELRQALEVIATEARLESLKMDAARA